MSPVGRARPVGVGKAYSGVPLRRQIEADRDRAGFRKSGGYHFSRGGNISGEIGVKKCLAIGSVELTAKPCTFPQEGYRSLCRGGVYPARGRRYYPDFKKLALSPRLPRSAVEKTGGTGQADHYGHPRHPKSVGDGYSDWQSALRKNSARALSTVTMCCSVQFSKNSAIRPVGRMVFDSMSCLTKRSCSSNHS